MLTVVPLSRGRHATSARAQTCDLLRELIISLRLEPGERVSDVAWAERLGVSRTPVREALLQLADEELVEVVPQLGTFVAPISTAAVREAQFIREALEVAALRLAVERLGDADLASLEDNIAAQRDAQAAHDPERFYELDEAFHRRLVDATQLPNVWRVAERSRAHLNRVRRLSLPEPEVIRGLVAEHAEIAAALGARDLPRAEDAMRAHLGRVLAHLPTLVEKQPHFFVDAEHAAVRPRRARR